MGIVCKQWFGSSQALALVVLAATGCPGDGGCGGGEVDPGDGATSVSTTGGPVGTAATGLDPGLDSTGTPADPCIDDYEGNHSLASAFALGLDATTDIPRAIFGDQQLFGVGNEQGEDRLVVCPGSPDFFALEVACTGYLGVDLRRLGDGDLDLHVYDADGVEVDGAVGDWEGFVLAPLHRRVEAGEVAVEVRHAGGGAQGYALDVYVLPVEGCS